MKPAPLNYYAPDYIKEALNKLDEFGYSGSFLADG